MIKIEKVLKWIAGVLKRKVHCIAWIKSIVLNRADEKGKTFSRAPYIPRIEGNCGKRERYMIKNHVYWIGMALILLTLETGALFHYDDIPLPIKPNDGAPVLIDVIPDENLEEQLRKDWNRMSHDIYWADVAVEILHRASIR